MDPWYANNPNAASLQYADLHGGGSRAVGQAESRGRRRTQNWLLGFSKSGLGAQDLLFKYPQVFSVAGSWDFPADMNSYSQFGSSSADVYGTNANFQSGYQL